MTFSPQIEQAVDTIKSFIAGKFLSVHLRNGADWVRACQTLEQHKLKNFMASPQCGTPELKLEFSMCLQNISQVLSSLENEKIRKIYLSTDNLTYEKEISNAGFETFTLKKFLPIDIDEDLLPMIDLAIHTESDLFFANCVSSFSSFAVRHRSNTGKPVKFLALPTPPNHSEL